MDVKSPNVLLGRNSTAKLADVGLAKFLHKDYLSVAKSVGTFAWSVSRSCLSSCAPFGRTAPTVAAQQADVAEIGCILNTFGCPPLQAPEVLMGSRCSEKVDIFSLGVVLWELVTGEHTCMPHFSHLLIRKAANSKHLTTLLALLPQARARLGAASGPSSAVPSLGSELYWMQDIKNMCAFITSCISIMGQLAAQGAAGVQRGRGGSHSGVHGGGPHGPAVRQGRGGDAVAAGRETGGRQPS